MKIEKLVSEEVHTFEISEALFVLVKLIVDPLFYTTICNLHK